MAKFTPTPNKKTQRPRTSIAVNLRDSNLHARLEEVARCEELSVTELVRQMITHCLADL